MLIISTQCFAPSTGGIETVMSSLAAYFPGSETNVTVFADHTKLIRQQEFDKTCKFDIRRYSGFKPLRRRKKATEILKFITAQGQGKDIVLLTDTWKSIEFIDTVAFSKSVCLAHGSEIPKHPSQAKQSRIRRAYAKASLIIANSNYTAGLVRPYLSGKQDLKIINPGIQAPEIDQAQQQKIERQLAARQPILITIARLEARKNHQSIIKALPDLIKSRPGLLYVIIGDGPEKKALEATAKKLNLADHVLFTGRLEGAQKNAYLANSDLFMMPGVMIGDDVEGFGLAYIEAGVFGIPCIASDAGGSGEAVLHNKTGLVCKAGDQAQLEKSILELLESPGQRRSLGNQARIRSASFLWEEKIHEYAKLLN